MTSLHAEAVEKCSRQSPLRVKLLVLGLLGLVVVVVLFAFDPTASNLFPPCPFHYLTGWHCPGCGSLRALHDLVHADLVGALGMNPLMVASLPFVSYALIRDGLRELGVYKRPVRHLHPAVIWSILCVIMVFWILRNIPYEPFVLLAP